MPVLHIEHEISDLSVWLEAFQRFAPAREQAGVLQAEVFQPYDDPHYIVVKLRFESVDAATNFRNFLTNVVWASPDTSPALVGTPTARVLTEVGL
jgi:heme-degrading monooxygenase HmoA